MGYLCRVLDDLSVYVDGIVILDDNPLTTPSFTFPTILLRN